MQNILLISLLCCFMFSCSQSGKNSQESEATDTSAKGITVAPFGNLSDGTPVSLYTLNNGNGAIMKVMDYGGIIVSLNVPDKNNESVDVILGYDSLEQYEKKNPFF